MEQNCEEPHMSNVEVEQPLEAMHLPVLPIQLEGGSKCEEVVVVVVVVADHFDVDDVDVEDALIQA